MLYLHAAAPQQRTFVESVTWALDGPLDASRFRRAWEAVVAATPMLRTRFEPNATPQPLQVVEATAALPFAIDDHSGCEGAAARAAAVDVAVRRERAAGIDLEAAPLLRLRLLRFAPTSHALVLTIHHLVEDGWSLRLIVDMVSRAYSGAALPVGPSYDVKLRHEVEVCTAGGPSELFWREAMRGYAGPPPLLPGAPPPVCSADDAAATRASVVVSAATMRALRGRAAGGRDARIVVSCGVGGGAVGDRAIWPRRWSTAARSRVAAPHAPVWASSSGPCSTRRPSASASALRTRRQRRSSVAFLRLLRRQPHEAFPLAHIQQRVLTRSPPPPAARARRSSTLSSTTSLRRDGVSTSMAARRLRAPTIIDRIGTPLSIRFMLQRPPSGGRARVTATSECDALDAPFLRHRRRERRPRRYRRRRHRRSLAALLAAAGAAPTPRRRPPLAPLQVAAAPRLAAAAGASSPRRRCRARRVLDGDARLALSSQMDALRLGCKRHGVLPPPPPAPPSPRRRSPLVAPRVWDRRALAAAAPPFILEVEAGDRRERSFAEHAARATAPCAPPLAPRPAPLTRPSFASASGRAAHRGADDGLAFHAAGSSTAFTGWADDAN